MIDPWVERFKLEILPSLLSDFKAKMVIVFGSRVSGTPIAESDIDVVVISNYFAKISFLKRMPLLLKEIPFPKHVDYICYTPEEFEKLKTSSTIIMEALESGLRIA
jgi:predicted nucleotidyltransferase